LSASITPASSPVAVLKSDTTTPTRPPATAYVFEPAYPASSSTAAITYSEPPSNGIR